MARDMEMEMLIKPIVDTKAFDAGLKTLKRMADKGVSGLSNKESARFEALSSRLIASLVVSGRATTATQGRMQIQSALGKISGQTASVLRGSQNIAEIAIRQGRVMPYGSFSERQIKGWRADLAGAAGAYNTMLSNYAAFKGAPSEQSRDALLKAVLSVNTQLSNISKDRKKEIKTFGRIEKDTNAIYKEASGWKAPLEPSRTASALGAAQFFKAGMKGLLGVFGITSIIGAIKKLISMGVQGIQQGYNDLVEQSIYGANRDIAGARTHAAMYGMKEESLVGAERYALDFRQRMMWGEVSDKEWIALSRLGGLGSQIISGEAARNPDAFRRSIQNYIRQNRGNEAEIRQMLGWLGWSPDLMAYGAVAHEPEREEMLKKTYEELVRQNKISALSTLIPAQILKTTKAQISEVTGRGIRSLFAGEESQRLLYRSMTGGSGFTGSEIERSYAELGKKISDYNSGKYDTLRGFANFASPGAGEVLDFMYKTNLDMQQNAAQTYRQVPIATREGTKEGAKEGVIEGLKEVFKNTMGSINRGVASLASIFSSNAGAD